MTRDRKLTAEEATKFKAIRSQVAGELPELVARHHERMTTLDQVEELLAQPKAAREAKGLSLGDLADQKCKVTERGGSAQPTDRDGAG